MKRVLAVAAIRLAPGVRALGMLALGGLSLVVALAGCASSGVRNSDARRLPMVPGTRVVERIRQCDEGSQAYCAIEMVVVAPHMHTSWDLVNAESKLLGHRRWVFEDAANGDEHAAQSPGDKLRVTYATAYGDLQGIDLGWIQRSHRITQALSKVLFDRGAAMSVMLEVGS
jgi:hypothetical protein